MTSWDDLTDDMGRISFDDATVDRLLAGSLAPDDAPPALRQVASLVGALGQPGTAEELRSLDRVVPALAAAARTSVADPTTRRKSMLIGRLTVVRVLAIAAPLAFVGAGAAAAATGSLPDAAQSAVSTALSHVDISVPNPHAHDSGTTNSSANSNAKGPDASPTSPATFGLCTAYTAGGLSSHGVAYRNLAAAAGGAGSIASYCAPILANHHSTSSDNGTSSSNDTGGTGTSDQHGPPFSTPPVSTPAKGKPSTVPPPHS